MDNVFSTYSVAPNGALQAPESDCGCHKKTDPVDRYITRQRQLTTALILLTLVVTAVTLYNAFFRRAVAA